MKTNPLLRTVVVVFSLCAAAISAYAQSSAFNYQGSLSSGGVPASGSYDVEFRLFDAATNGNLVGGPFTNSPTAVSNGVFNAAVSFAGTNAFPGADRWVSLAVRTNVSGPGGLPFVTLAPRQKILALPYSITSLNGVTEAARAVAVESQFAINLADLDDDRYLWRARATTIEITVSNEVGRALAAEITLTNNAFAEVARAKAAESNLVVLVSEETSRALAVETGFNLRVVTLETVFPPLAITVTNEVARALAAEAALSSSLNSNLNNEVIRAQAAEATVSINLTNETIRALAAEATENARALQAEAGEFARAHAVETNLSTSGSAESSRALAAEGFISGRVVTLETVLPALATTVSNEVGRATAAEITLTNNLANEISRAVTVESTLSVNLNTESYTWRVRSTNTDNSVSNLAVNVNTEVTRATAAESVEATRATAAEITLSNSMAWLKSGSNTTFTAGNVGIGITNPGTALAVAGDADIKGSVRAGTFSIVSVSTNVPTAGSTLIPATGYVKLAPAAAVTLAVPASIAPAAVPGTVLILQGTDNIKTVTIPNTGNVSMTTPKTLGLFDTLILLWIGDRWVQQSYTDN